MDIIKILTSKKFILLFFIIIFAFIFDIIINTILNNRLKINKKISKHEQRSRETIYLLFKNIVKIIIIIIVILSVLQTLGVDTSALITGVGAISLVIGLAFQDLLKDILVGISIILESQFAIGEIVEINGFKGEVISLTLKSTRLKSMTGEVKIISNRTINEVINYSLDNVLVKINISVSYEDDINKVEKVLNGLIKDLNKSIKEIKDDICLAGVDNLSSSSVDFLITTKTSVKNQYIVKRKILREIKLILDKNNIKIPYTQIEVHYEK